MEVYSYYYFADRIAPRLKEIMEAEKPAEETPRQLSARKLKTQNMLRGQMWNEESEEIRDIVRLKRDDGTYLKDKGHAVKGEDSDSSNDEGEEDEDKEKSNGDAADQLSARELQK